MLLHHSPVHRSLIGLDSHKGWLPTGAAEPLPQPPQPALLDLRLLQDGAEYLLTWCSHAPIQWTQASAKGNQHFSTYGEALAAAHTMFGIEESNWTFDFRGRTPEASDVAELVTLVLEAHGVEDPEPEGWGHRCIPPRLAPFDVAGGKPERLWLVLEGPEYVVFYDAATGDTGLGLTTADRHYYTYVGDYGPLWATLQAM